ncbi:DNA polymerase III subunit alpha [Leadbettera azotonutricia]|uniref:DNA polymerase III subunit alpha n=1 Tax=Leadbettera azotonutricia (strain ATCC BAA-888 / DSM 13862 / ZAS-9) TaxID=545695 RepID=F5YAG9_LEAAZ|nr:DNA polymerase III subunit alpha [Leadbettera azotonutricia]AEF82175.1 DNA polymerase III subunit alpha [Leadbettera azotonutricia ZAS-9]
MTDFVHLHVHSDFSLLDGAASVEGLAKKAASLEMKHLAITDHGNMFGVLKFVNACLGDKDHPLKNREAVHPIIGCEFYMAPGSRHERKGSENGNKYYHLVLLSTCEEGYRNLMKLSSLSYTEGFYYKPRIDRELLEKYHKGLICLSACLAGEIPSLIMNGQLKEAEKSARWFASLMGEDNFYLELQDHGIEAQRQVNPIVAGIARRTGIPLVATNDIHYLERADSVVQDILLCIGTNSKRGDERRMRFEGEEFYFKTGDEMAALFPEYPEAIANTVRIAERCKTEIPTPGPLLPDFEIPAGFSNADEYLRHLTMDGLEKRYPGRMAEVIERAEYELGVIIKMGFPGYFLIVADFINWAKERNIPVGPGRGSGAGSIVAYALRITNNDPLKYNLLFERFLNPERISMPDFDVDFTSEGRADVIEYVTQKYGKEKVGQIITFGTLKAKAAIKDVARALDISIDESNMITKLIPDKNPEDPQKDVTLKVAFAYEPRLRELEQDPRYQELFAMARKLEGKNRNSSIHASGVVIGKTDLTDYVPLYMDKDGAVASQYTMDLIEPQGLVKMDFLGLKTLDLIDHSVKLIHRRGGKDAAFDIEKISETGTAESDAVFKMLGEGRSYGIFQFESEGMQKTLKDAKPASIKELTALNALYRPGPMEYIQQFIAAKWGRTPIVYPDPSLESILKETYGVIVYQEQVMKVAQIIAGYTLGQADILRKAMGKKKRDILDREKVPFIAGAVKQGFTEADADRIFEIMAPFAGYGFNKSHAAAYAVLAYQTAYLKANFPVEFMAANMTNEISSTDKLPLYIDEARRMGITIDPPDINRSDRLFSVVEGRIVYGFLGIKGLGVPSAEEIISCRKNGPYKNFMDFLSRVDIKTVGKKNIEILIQTGAFDCFGVGRATLLGNLEKTVEYTQSIKDDKKFGQVSLFGETGEKDYPDFTFEVFPEMSGGDKLKTEKELIGFYFSGHPMDEYKEVWKRIVKVDLGKPESLPAGNCTLVGLIKNIKPITTSKGAKMAFASIADYNGEIEITFFADAWEKCRDKIAADQVAILRGKIEYQKDKDRHSFLAEDTIDPLNAEAAAKQEETQSLKWNKYRNIWKYAKELDLKILDTRSALKATKGNYTIIGSLKSLRTHTDKKGNEMAFGTLQDERGEIDLVFFARDWKNCKPLAAVDEIAALNGGMDPAADRDPAKPSFKVTSFQDINKLVRAAAKKAAADNTMKNENTITTQEDADQDGRSFLDSESEGTTETDSAASDSAVIARSAFSIREVHVRLRGSAAEKEEALYPLLNYVKENPGSCTLLIHVPAAEGETVIRTATGIVASASMDVLAHCSAVAEAWSV